MSVRPGPDQARACVVESGSGSRLVDRRRKVVDLTVYMFQKLAFGKSIFGQYVQIYTPRGQLDRRKRVSPFRPATGFSYSRATVLRWENAFRKKNEVKRSSGPFHLVNAK
ncbi:hypothetical protein CROQUDRAFT_99619 [Cronartium quercuum f. sp. fusiforme G11]|uniref:Uncharacterized protein n=1 Tax=Cronartium quercuum f. sp. fusiforme G11 TaxID=708437 RepID=A0A9P6T7T9_9BASI|nr:hypothetical protein CROQUDRAFT_99619 [Cronartium quercuum f. sp. fusiforme G11]